MEALKMEEHKDLDKLRETMTNVLDINRHAMNRILTEHADEFNEKFKEFEIENHSVLGYVFPTEVFKDDYIIEPSQHESYFKAIDYIQSKLTPEERQEQESRNQAKIKHFEKYRTIYRSTGIEEVGNFYKMGQKVGAGREGVNYGKEQDFVSGSIDRKEAADIVLMSGQTSFPVVIEYDMSDANEDTYSNMKYQIQPNCVSMKDDGMNTYRVAERYGGTHPLKYAQESEYHLKPGRTQKIKRIYIPRETLTQENISSDHEHSRADRYKEYTEKLKYAGIPDDVEIIIAKEGADKGLYASLTNTKDMADKREEYIQYLMKKYDQDREHAEAQIRKWAPIK